MNYRIYNNIVLKMNNIMCILQNQSCSINSMSFNTNPNMPGYNSCSLNSVNNSNTYFHLGQGTMNWEVLKCLQISEGVCVDKEEYNANSKPYVLNTHLYYRSNIKFA